MIKSVTLNNFGRHKERTFQFAPGLCGILGHNGSGKSTALAAIYYALTGASMNDGKLMDDVRSGTTSMSVNLVYSTPAGDLNITRKMQDGVGRVLLKHGTTQLNKAKEVDPYILELLGTNESVLRNNVFAKQGGIDRILDFTNTERLKELQQVFNLSQVESAYKCLGVEISSYVVTPGLEEQLVKAQQELTTVRAEVELIRGQVTAAEHEVARFLEEAGDIIPRAEEARRNQLLLDAARGSLDQALKNLEAQRVELTSTLEARDEAEVKHSDCTPDTLKQANDRLATLQGLLAQTANYRMVCTQLEEAKRKLDACTVQDVEPVKAELDAARNSIKKVEEILGQQHGSEGHRLKPAYDLLTQLQNKPAPSLQPDSELADLKAKADLLASQITAASGTVCPTCKRPMSGSAEDWEHLQAEKARMEEELAGMREAIKARMQAAVEAVNRDKQEYARALAAAQAAYQAEREKFEGFFATKLNGFKQQETKLSILLRDIQVAASRREVLDASVQELQAKSESLACEDVDQAVVAQAGAEVQRISDGIRCKSGFAGLLDSARAKLDALSVTVAEQQAKFNDIAQTLQQIKVPTAEEVEMAKQCLVQAEVAKHEVSNLRAKLSEADAKAGFLSSTVDRLSQQLNKEAKDSSWVKVVQAARDALHVSAYPTAVMREYVSIINRKIAYYLDILEAPFKFFLEPESMCFLVEFPDGRKHQAFRLSGAQRVMAGIAFRLSLADTFARSVGFVALDEPSAYMDVNSIQALQNLFLKLKTVASSQAKQIILITHEPAFMASMDHVIEV